MHHKITQKPQAVVMPDIQPAKSHSLIRGFDAKTSVSEFTFDEDSLKFGLMTLNRPKKDKKSRTYTKLSKNAKMNRIKSHESPLRTIQNKPPHMKYQVKVPFKKIKRSATKTIIEILASNI
jgi:hypothetical protein